MDLNSGHVVTHCKVTKIPVTQMVINAVEQMAYKQGFKELKFKNQHGVILHPANWIAGVDYENPNNENKDEEDEEYLPEEEELDDDDELEAPEDNLNKEEMYDRVNQQEINELMAEDINPTISDRH